MQKFFGVCRSLCISMIWITLLFIGCEGIEGPPGPQGPQGEQGPPGECTYDAEGIEKINVLTQRLDGVEDDWAGVSEYLDSLETRCQLMQEQVEELSERLYNIAYRLDSIPPDPPQVGGYADVFMNWDTTTTYDNFNLQFVNEFTSKIDSAQLNIWSGGIFDYIAVPEPAECIPELGANQDSIDSDYIRIRFNNMLLPGQSFQCGLGDIDGDRSEIIIDMWTGSVIRSAFFDSTGSVRFYAGTAPSIGEITLIWNPNAEEDLAGYKIYYGLSSRSYDTILDVNNVTEATIKNLVADVTYYFAVTAYDLTGNESGYSNEVEAVIE